MTVHQNKKEDRTPITVLFVPKTPGGILAKLMREAEEEIEKLTGDRVKVVERAGTMIKRILSKSNPWAGESCGRTECLVCRYEEGGGDCMRRNATYKTECLSCKEKAVEKTGKEKFYFGETARTTFERGQEHENDYLKGKEDSHMMKHWIEAHPNEDKPRFSMKVLRGHTSAFVRQIHEAVLIEMHADNVLNSKGEFNRCQLPRLGVKMGEKSICEEEPAQEMTEKDVLESVQMDRKRKEKRQENTGPASKRKKCHIRRPEFKSAPKRMRSSISEELETRDITEKGKNIL